MVLGVLVVLIDVLVVLVALVALVLLMLVWSPETRAFREHPRFLEIDATRGLLEFWAEHGEPDACRLAATTPPQLECDR